MLANNHTHTPFIIPKIAEYLNKQTNNSLEKYFKQKKYAIINNEEQLSNNNDLLLQYSGSILPKKEQCYPCIYFSFVACISFLAGYNFHKLTNR